MAEWEEYQKYIRTRHVVVGDMRVLPQVHSPELGNARDIFVYLPPSYAQGQHRYPVIYMHDGQNLFDPVLSFAGEWHVDESMELLAHEGLEAIVVGVPNAGEKRLEEYGPFASGTGEPGRAAAYVAFLADTLKPLIDRSFRTRPEREYTGTAGSSMGGLISLFALFHRPDVFGMAGAMSPSLWFGYRATMDYIDRMPHTPARIYLDVGTREGPQHGVSPARRRGVARRYRSNVRILERMLIEKGYRSGSDLYYVEEPGGIHNEANWARRFPNMARYFISGVVPDDRQLTLRHLTMSMPHGNRSGHSRRIRLPPHRTPRRPQNARRTGRPARPGRNRHR